MKDIEIWVHCLLKIQLNYQKMGLEVKLNQVTNSPLANGIGYTSAYDLKELFIKSLSMLTVHDCVYPFVIMIISVGYLSMYPTSFSKFIVWVTRFQEKLWKNKEIKIRVFHVYHEPKVW